MTDRERWTVYPLLFLALGVSLKDKLAGSVDTKHIRCQTMVCKELAVVDGNGNKRIEAVNGDLQAIRLVCGALVVPNAKGKSAVLISSNQFGGLVSTLGAGTGITCMLGNADRGKSERIAGLMFVEANGIVHPGQVFTSRLPVREPEQSESSPPESNSTERPSDEKQPSEEKPPADEKPVEAPSESNPPELP